MSDLIRHCLPMSHKKDEMQFPTTMNWRSPFPILEVLGGILYFFSKFNIRFCKQTVKILIKHRILRCLIWTGTVCPCPIKRTLGLYGLTTGTNSNCIDPTYVMSRADSLCKQFRPRSVDRIPVCVLLNVPPTANVLWRLFDLKVSSDRSQGSNLWSQVFYLH